MKTAGVLLLLFLSGSSLFAAETNLVRVLGFGGSVEFLRAGASRWDQVTTNLVLDPGDRIRTGSSNSFAILKMRDATDCRMRENSLYQIPGAGPKDPLARLLRGWFYFFNRDKGGDNTVDSPGMATVIRGTEFGIHVGDDDTTSVVLIEGEVEMIHPLRNLTLTSGQVGTAGPGSAPRQTALLKSMDLSRIQWCLYYPAILNPDDLPPAEDLALERSALTAYREGDLLSAVRGMSVPSPQDSPSRRLLRAALELAAGEPDRAENSLALIETTGDPRLKSLIAAMRMVMESVRTPGSMSKTSEFSPPSTSTEWLALSYCKQSEGLLIEALDAAQAACRIAPGFGFAWTRLAELQLSFGRTVAARRTLAQAVASSPRNAQARAIEGFLFAAVRQWQPARDAFDAAIQLDPRLANGWLGRGLVRIQTRDLQGGRQDLQTAAAVEPQRAMLRSYLAFVLEETGSGAKARHEIQLATQLDPLDPTPLLYSALIHQNANEVNDAVRDMTDSRNLVSNRSIYRSQNLLNQDRAVRSANLASIYQDAGLTDFSVREAVRALDADYSSFAAHLFLANSYDALRDPRQINLRYETPAVAEYLTANLLAPVGAGILSPSISQNEYSSLLKPNRPGVSAFTEYRTGGDWIHSSSHFATFERMSYSLDAGYLSSPGDQPNGQFEQLTLSLQLKLQLAPSDTLYFHILGSRLESGDSSQHYNPDVSQKNLVREETQQPMFLAGYHRDWNPNHHTIVLFGRLADEFGMERYSHQPLEIAATASGVVRGVDLPTFPANYFSDTLIHTAEVQHIALWNSFTWIAGVRAQSGEWEVRERLGRPTGTRFSFLYSNPASAQSVSTSFDRISSYSHGTWNLLDSLALTAGFAFDHVNHPVNHLFSPVSADEREQNQWSPKAGIVWSPGTNTTLRAAYSRSLGGVSFDQSFNLEPTLVAGINQSYRSLVPESLTGSIAVPGFEMIGFSFDQSFSSGTFLTASAGRLWSRADRIQGAMAVYGLGTFEPDSVLESLKLSEDHLKFSLGQLIGRQFSVVAELEWTRTGFRHRFPDLPDSVFLGGAPVSDSKSVWRSLSFTGIWRSPHGPFAEARTAWVVQENLGQSSPVGGEDFWMTDLFAGYRWPKKRAEIRVGLLNAFGQDYRLSPLNWHNEWPRQRTISTSLRFNF